MKKPVASEHGLKPIPGRSSKRSARVLLATLVVAGVLTPASPAAAAGGDHSVVGTGCWAWAGWERVPVGLIYVEAIPWFSHACLRIEASTAGGGSGTVQLFGVESPSVDWWSPSLPTTESEEAVELLDLQLDCVMAEESPSQHKIFASGTNGEGERAWVTVTANGFWVEEYEDPFTPCGADELVTRVEQGGYTIEHSDPSPNAFPTADFEATCLGLTCTLDASTSTDADGEVVRYRWWVDQRWTYDAPQSRYGGENVSITLSRANLLDVRLLVTDDNGGTNTVTKEVNVGLPVSKQLTPSCKGLTCTFDASASTDPDGTVAHYYWNLYDDNRSANGTSPRLTHTYSGPGTFITGVRVQDNDGNVSPWMDWVKVEVSAAAAAPEAPSSLTAKAESTSAIRLDWMDVSGETGYKIQRSLDGAAWTQIATAPAASTTYTDSGLAPNTTYRYRVIATNDSGDSTPSPVAIATTLADTTAPTAPTNLVATGGQGRIRLTWGASTDAGGSGISGYKIYRGTGGASGTFTVVASGITSTSYDDVPVKKGTTYSYYVLAVDRAGNTGASSNVATVRAT